MTVLGQSKSDILRNEYISAFVNCDSPHYRKYIEQKRMFTDGMCYVGYLWDCLLNMDVISEYRAKMMLTEKRDVFIMWDIHSCERIFIPDYWKYPKTSVLYAAEWSDSLMSDLPEDLYLFDETFMWSVIFTHETNDKGRRYCLYVEGRGNEY